MRERQRASQPHVPQLKTPLAFIASTSACSMTSISLPDMTTAAERRAPCSSVGVGQALWLMTRPEHVATCSSSSSRAQRAMQSRTFVQLDLREEGQPRDMSAVK